ncbi:MAG: glycosyltransferase family 4 protein [Lachnospiraceae bacterium]|nr:glycosyltransferase family 4 protein [Lachnospiraceae bacterium]
MNKKLLITSTDLMMIQFLVPHVKNLSENGFDVEIACSDVGGRMDKVREKLNDYVKAIHTVRLVRSPVSTVNIKGYKDMKQVVESGNYDIIWTNEPVMGVVTRLASRKVRKKGTKVIYMVHGFHFYKGAPFFNWMMFYPIEKFAGHFCDSVVTINKEDYDRAQKMKLPDVKYIHGIGINTERLSEHNDNNNIREELGLDEKDYIIISIGELSKRKNQRTIIKALSVLKNENIHYILCGKGDKQNSLMKLSEELGVSEKVHFLGYRMDVVDICRQADVFVMPSYHEGLPVAALEAMYCGTAIVASNIRGIVDIIEDGKNGYLCGPDDSNSFADRIRILRENPDLIVKMVETNIVIVKDFCIDSAKKEVLELFS